MCGAGVSLARAQGGAAKGTGAASTAAPSASAAASAPGTSAPRDPNRPGALAAISAELARALGPRSQKNLVVASTITADLEPVKDKSDALAAHIAQDVAGALGAGRAHDHAVSLAVARGLARSGLDLVYLQIEVQKGVLSVTADQYPAVRNGWERMKGTPAASAHAFARAPIDAEVRSAFAPIPLEKLALHKAKLDESDVVGLGCGDPDGAGVSLFVVTRERVVRGHVLNGKFVALASERWHTLAKRAPAPLREPLASVVVAPRTHRGEVWIRTTDYDGVRLDGSLHVLGTLAGMPVPWVESAKCTNVVADSATLESRVERCLPEGDKGVLDLGNIGATAGKSDRLLAWSGASATGTALPLTLLAREPNGALRVTTAGSSQSLDNVGAELAVGDMNLDGEPEIAFAADRGDDVLRLMTITPRGPVERGKWFAPEGVRAVAFCPAEEKGAPALAAVVGREVWLAR